MFNVLVTAYNCEAYIGRCVDSIKRQTHAQFRCFVLDDCSTDGTVQRALEMIDADTRFQLVRSERKYYQLGNYDKIIRGKYGIARDDVVIQVDGDDWLPDDEVFDRVALAYMNRETWLTYGQFQFASGRPGFASPMDWTDIRKAVFTASALRSWKAFLWTSITVPDLYYDGWYASTAGDLFFVLPMLEMAGPEHTTFLLDTVNYIYNDHNPLRDRTVDAAKQRLLAAYARSKTPYGRIGS